MLISFLIIIVLMIEWTDEKIFGEQKEWDQRV